MSNRNFVLDGEAVDASVRALFSEVNDQLSNELYYPEHGFNEYFPEIPDDKLSTVSGFGKGTLTVAGQQYGSNQRYKGFASTINLRKYTSEIEYSEEDLHWLQLAPQAKRIIEFRNNIEGAVNALNANVNDDAAKLDYLAHGTTFFTGGDSVPLADNAHSIRKPGITSHANTFLSTFGDSSTHLVFSAEALIEALQRMDRFPLNDGTQIRKGRNFRILHATELSETVQRVLTSMYGPENALLGKSQGSKDAQGMLGRRIDNAVIPDQPTGFKTYWAIVELNRARKMRWIAWGWKPRLNDQSERRKGLFFNEGSVLFAPHASDWRHEFFSKGDATTVT